MNRKYEMKFGMGDEVGEGIDETILCALFIALRDTVYEAISSLDRGLEQANAVLAELRRSKCGA